LSLLAVSPDETVSLGVSISGGCRDTLSRFLSRRVSRASTRRAKAFSPPVLAVVSPLSRQKAGCPSVSLPNGRDSETPYCGVALDAREGCGGRSVIGRLSISEHPFLDSTLFQAFDLRAADSELLSRLADRQAVAQCVCHPEQLGVGDLGACPDRG